MPLGLELEIEERATLFDAIRKAADHAGIGISVSETDGDRARHVFVNEAASQMLGYTSAELYPRDVWELLAPEEATRFRAMMERRRAGERIPSVLETVLVHRDGHRVPVELAQSRTALQSRSVIVSFLYDISARNRAVQALRESEERFRDLVEGAPDGVVILRGREVLYLNPRAATLLGLPDEKSGIGRDVTEFLHPEDRERALQRGGRVLATGPLEDRAEYRTIDRNGGEHTVEISSIPIEYQGARAVLAFARDVTERQRMQSKLQEADRLAALGVLSAGVAHEINNPLAYVLLNLEYLKRELPKAADDPSRIEGLMVRVRDACHGAERVATIVRDLRTFARGEESTRQPVDLEAVIEAAIAIAEGEIRARGRIERAYATVPAVDGSPNRLEQVFLNLLLNAAQALPEGRADNVIRVSIRSVNGAVLVEVSDNGSGILPELLGKIFDPFFTTKPVGVGTGLGLPICRGIVQTHGGEITVSSKPGVGTTFSVSLPASKSSPTLAPAARKASEPGLRARGRVLIVDDEHVVGRTIKMLLQAEHDLTLAESGAEALEVLAERARAEPFDAILCDLMMPGMTGMELFEVIRREYPELADRVVFMTGGLSMLRASEFLDSVKNPKFEKPFDMAELRKTLHSLVARARQERP